MQKIIFATCLLAYLHVAVELKKANHLSKFKRIEHSKNSNFKYTAQQKISVPQEQWFNQSLDHFDHTNRKTWLQVK